MTHALLLRLFLSPSFFTVHVALRYLSLYSDNIGITYYLTRRLRELDTQELRDVWGFICHLLVTRTSKSRALEAFVIETCQRSTHIAILTLWFMQAALKDMAAIRHDNKSFVICQRILHQCHEIIFGDLPPLAPAPYSGLSIPFKSRILRRKIKPHVEPGLVGIGLVLAGTPGLPALTEVMGEVAIEQGRFDEEGTEMRSLDNHESRAAPSPQISDDPDTPDAEDGDIESPNGQNPQDLDDATPRALEFPQNRMKPKQLPHRKTVSAAQTTPALPLHLRDIKPSRFSVDPLGQLDTDPQVKSPYQSSPSIATHNQPRSASVNFGEALLRSYDDATQSHLLRGHYCRSEVQFILTLENISNRLLVIPKPARVSALRAELTALNHKLPAEVCMPMWCSSSDACINDSATQPHHRIIRIPPGESVVLNSAERAPYLLLIEILNDDLDFDPTKRNNKDVLRKIVTKEEERKGASRDLVQFNPSGPLDRRKSTAYPANVEGISEEKSLAASASLKALPPTPKTADVSPNLDDDEEVDLVEQLYGTNIPLRSRAADLSETIVLPPAPKNKELDMATWSRASSVPSSPAVDSSSAFRNTPNLNIPSNLSRTRAPSPLALHEPPNEPVGHRVLSLDDYSERMRTAAIMLAQLNANLVRETVTSVPVPGAAGNPEAQSSTWLPGSKWLASSTEPPASAATPHNGSSYEANQTTRMRLQPAEAAAIRERIMKEMLALEEERMIRMRQDNVGMMPTDISGSMKSAEDESIIRRELNKADPSAVVFSETWATKKSRIRHESPYGHLANWDCVSVIVKTGGDLRQEQLATQLIQQFERIFKEENCQCWLRHFRIVITGGSSGLVETITDAVSIHSIKKAEYARRLAEGRFGHVTLLDHFKQTYGDPSSAKFARAQRNFAKSLAGYSLVSYLLQIKDRHNGNILLDRDGHVVHIDFGFMLSNSPGNIGFEAAPFKLPPEYVEVLGGATAPLFLEFKRLFREGFEAARKHCDRIITLVELMQKDSTLPCFAAFGEQTASQLRDRFQPMLTHSLVAEHVERLIESSIGSNWTRLYDSYQYYSQSIL
ncbi:hypothetical protein HGRIS_013042 [Hohenbuehelia grisea]|uniref:PI3K/PI4K catalytic domain-containing protein n=1 Tax=Hohenbuehelia grisea TaxID=104357 RepID=A0ABR3IU60_9AGAR